VEKTLDKVVERVAVIDMGSSSVRMVIANILRDGHFVVCDELKEQVRLGQDMDRDGFLKPARVSQAIKILKMFKKLTDTHNVTKVYPVATNAVRRAKNQKSFLEEIHATCGFKFRVLSSPEETELIYRGVINSLEVPKGVILDISGSGVSLVHYNRRHILNQEYFPFGTMSLSDLFSDVCTDPVEQAQMIQNYCLDQFASCTWLKELDPDTQFVGVGGAFRNLAKITMRKRRYPIDMVHNFHISEENFNTIYDLGKTLDADKRAKIKGLSTERADLFISALACIKSFMEFSNFKNIIISGSGIREGLLYQHAVPTTIEKPISDVLGHSLQTLMRQFDINVKHAEHVCFLCVTLYKQLRVLHKLPRHYLKVLRVAALLHDAGLKIKFYDYPRHSFYFILNSGLQGFSHREIILAAFVAMGHKSEEFNLAEWKKFESFLNPEDLVAVLKLSAILRIASSLDRSMCCDVKDISCDVLGDSVIMKTEVVRDCSLEIKDALKAGPEFAKAFKKNLEIL